MKIAIIGSRGIPNTYGGFEYFAQNLSQELLQRGFKVTVFQISINKIKISPYNGIERIAIRIPKFLPGYSQKVLYNIKSLIKASNKEFDFVICCGHSPALFFPFFSKKFLTKLIVNMDGLEWKRPKWGILAKRVLKITERCAIKYAKIIVADSKVMVDYLQNKYDIKPKFIAYGAHIPSEDLNPDYLEKFGVEPNEYGLIIARIEPENQIEIAIDAFVNAKKTLLIIGDMSTRYGRNILKKQQSNKNLIFAGAQYCNDTLNSLRAFSKVYIHGHTVGGTNPSLLEAMACGCTILAHDNLFNREVLDNLGYYFLSKQDMQMQLAILWSNELNKKPLMQNRITQSYTWEKITGEYIKLLNFNEKRKL